MARPRHPPRSQRPECLPSLGGGAEMNYDDLFVTEMFGFNEIPLEFDNSQPEEEEEDEDDAE